MGEGRLPTVKKSLFIINKAPGLWQSYSISSPPRGTSLDTHKSRWTKNDMLYVGYSPAIVGAAGVNVQRGPKESFGPVAVSKEP